ncbi:hypothetical protein [Aeoliella sp.]
MNRLGEKSNVPPQLRRASAAAERKNSANGQRLRYFKVPQMLRQIGGQRR